MVICDRLEFRSWRPDFSSSEQNDPDWTRLSHPECELANTIEGLHWDNPMQVEVCDACGYPECGVGHYVHVSRLGDLVIWSAPQIDESDDWHVRQYTPSLAIRRLGALGFPELQWQLIRRYSKAVPRRSDLTVATGRVLADGWRWTARGPTRVSRLEDVVPMLEDRLVGGESLGVEEAVGHVRALVDWLGAIVEQPVEGEIVEASAVGADIELLYFDGPKEFDWPAIALLDGAPLLALSSELVFLPGGAARTNG